MEFVQTQICKELSSSGLDTIQSNKRSIVVVLRMQNATIDPSSGCMNVRTYILSVIPIIVVDTCSM